jgi:phosphate transport system substrate-binding protein
VLAALITLTTPRANSSAQALVHVTGAGATFPSPVYAKWIAAYAVRDPGADFSYDAVGSERGVQRLLDGQVDFAACDDPEILRRLAGARAGDYVLVPSVVGGVVPVANVPGFGGTIAFTPELLSGIYLGQITKWNDPRLQRLNRNRLPNIDIVVVHRSDGSGTSAVWTRYLANVSDEWQRRVGIAASPAWPTGRGAEGNDGVANLVTRTVGAIGYVEFMHALQAHASYGRIRNRSGAFVSASLESIAAAAQSAEPTDPLTQTIVDAPGRTAYPVASFTWLVVPSRVSDEAKYRALQAFLRWC